MSTRAYTIHYMDGHRLAKRGLFGLEEARKLASNISLYSERSVILKEHTPFWYTDSNRWTDEWWVHGVHCSEFTKICETCKRPWDSAKTGRDSRYCACDLCRSW